MTSKQKMETNSQTQQPIKVKEQKTPVWQFKAHSNWVKAVLIADTVDAEAKVVEIGCDGGVDFGKWTRSKISKLFAFETDEKKLSEAKERWEKKNKPFQAEFYQFDPTVQFIETIFNTEELKLENQGKIDCVASFCPIQQIISTQKQLEILFKNVSWLIKPGGTFIGLLPDSSAIWSRAQKKTTDKRETALSMKTDLYEIQFENQNFDLTNTSYRIKLAGDKDFVSEFLIHFPSLISIAQEVGFRMLAITNLNEFYEEHHRVLKDMLETTVLKDGKIDSNQKDLIGLYCCFVFQKLK